MTGGFAASLQRPCFSVDGLGNLALEIGEPQIIMPWLDESGLQVGAPDPASQLKPT